MAAASEFAQLVNNDPAKAHALFFATVVKHKTLSATAKALGINRVQLFHHMKRLELQACTHCKGSGFEPPAKKVRS